MTIFGQMTFGEVPAYVMKVYGVKVSRMTVYNWTKHGAGNESLQWSSVRNPTAHRTGLNCIKVVTPAQIEDFLDRRGWPRVSALNP